jgi:cytochrome c556
MKLLCNLFFTSIFVLFASGFALADDPKQAANAGPSPGKQAIAVRKAVFTLIANNFKPIGEVLQGKAAYNQAEMSKRAERVAFLSGMLEGTFPEDSNLGAPDTKAKTEIWEKKAEFDKHLKDFETNARALAKTAANETTASDAFKSAAKTVAEACKGCHDSFKSK